MIKPIVRQALITEVLASIDHQVEIGNIKKLLGEEIKKYVKQERWNGIPVRDFAIPIEGSFDMG